MLIFLTVRIYIAEELCKALYELFSPYYNDAAVQKLAPATDFQRNGCLNDAVGSKAPKILCYGDCSLC